jgi:hypothetical protein
MVSFLRQHHKLGGKSCHVVSTLLVACLVITSAAIVPVNFKSLESCTVQKLVIFHDPTIASSVQKLEIMKTLDSTGTYGDEYQFSVCDVTSEENSEKILASGMKEFPALFTQTNENGIEAFVGDLTMETFATFHDFRKMELSHDNVIRMKDLDGKGSVDGAGAMLAIASDRPVFMKMYEVIVCTP